jgi:release factor glutamine methyltransferase|tara:strand:+ start:3485 stop:4366 length:882 start_codon:yes stop_codon:yes gene_type:complete
VEEQPMADLPDTLFKVMKLAEHRLSANNSHSPHSEIEWLMMDLFSCSRAHLYLNRHQRLTEKKLLLLSSWVERRINGEPLQYITQRTEFFGLPIQLNQHVMIPRPETEKLVEVAIHHARKTRAATIVDAGTGSGCIAIAIAKSLPEVQLLALDCSEDALELASRNALRNGVADRIIFEESDVLTQNLPDSFDLLVSNPPYIPIDDMAHLPADVRDYEPIHALTDGYDGLAFYRRLCATARHWIASGGFMVLETGRGEHPGKVRHLFENAGFVATTTHQDYNGNDRVISIQVTE